MRSKPVPAPPADLAGLETIRNAVPLVPEPEGSCCERLSSRTDVDPERARDWLSFLRGLGLVREGSSGFYRTRGAVSDTDLPEALLAGVYGAREVNGILSDEPLTAEEVFERFESVPRWERHHHHDPEAVWRERVERLLGWLVLFGIAERREKGYVSRSGSRR